MGLATREDAVKLIAKLSSYYPSANRLTDLQVESFADEMEGADLAVLRATVLRVRDRCKFFPSFAELREHANAVCSAPVPLDEEAWAELSLVMRRRGTDRPPAPSDLKNPLLFECVRILDWIYVCQQPLKEVHERFRRVYADVVARRAEAIATAPLSALRLPAPAQQLEAAPPVDDAKQAEKARRAAIYAQHPECPECRMANQAVHFWPCRTHDLEGCEKGKAQAEERARQIREGRLQPTGA